MSVKDRDPLTGHQTTGHEWNGITELNTRVPRAVWFFIIVTHVWALVYWVLMPAWPLLNTYTKGLLGVDQQDRVEQQVSAANADRAVLDEPACHTSSRRNPRRSRAHGACRAHCAGAFR